ncbi:MAG: hypothetical protein FIA99_12690 [Ruminiclostridium sp.]|nr:hypothetical protein [Ruminiclostridium sp.]
MKKVKIILRMVIFSTSLFVNLIYTIISWENIENAINNRQYIYLFESFGSISDVIVALTSLTNIGLIFFFFKKDKESRAKELKANKKAYWFRTIVLEKYLIIIDKFFEENIKIVDTCKVIIENKSQYLADIYQQKIKEQFGRYTDEKITITQSFADFITVIDKKLGFDIDKLFEKFQDNFNINLQNYSMENEGYNDIILKNEIYKQKKLLIESLVKFDMNDN